MLEGFGDITYELTEQEAELVPIFISGLKNKVGKQNAVTSSHIINKLQEKGHKVNGARVRKIINHIRTAYLLPGLIATSKGYYISNDPEEIKQYIASLGHREAAISFVRNKMEEYLKQLQNKILNYGSANS